jgi:putative phage-type endonuclease
MFKIIEDLVQGSEEWHKRRNSGIGGTDAPVIMGENPWKSPKYLLEEKLGLRKRFEGNEHTRRGITLEPLARSVYEKITKIKLEPAVLQSNKLNWQFASTDGINVQKKKIIEIKCGIKAYEYTAENNIAPPYYYGQIQHILCVSGYKSLDFFCWLPDHDPVLVNIERDEEYIKRLVKEEFKFYQLLQNKNLSSSEPEKFESSYSQKQTTYNYQYNYTLLNPSAVSPSLSSSDKEGVEINLKNTEGKKSEVLSSKLNNISFLG